MVKYCNRFNTCQTIPLYNKTKKKVMFNKKKALSSLCRGFFYCSFVEYVAVEINKPVLILCFFWDCSQFPRVGESCKFSFLIYIFDITENDWLISSLSSKAFNKLDLNNFLF